VLASVESDLVLDGAGATVVGTTVTGEGLALLDTLEIVHLHLLAGQLSVLDTLDRHISTAG